MAGPLTPGSSAPAAGGDEPGFALLFVCTGNICRSPLAERFARAYLGTALGPGSAAVQVASAGTYAATGRSMDPASARVLQELGGDPSGFQAQRLTGRLAVAADLTLCMTRQHRQAVLAHAPRALARSFTLREAADLLAHVPAGELPGGTPRERARALVAALAAARSRHAGGADDDIADPIGQPDVVHEAVGAEIAAALRPLLDRLVPVVAARA